MELKIKVHAITLKDENSGEELTVKTVRTVQYLAEWLDETEGEALSDEVARLREQYLE
jgi:hypothetical protein